MRLLFITQAVDLDDPVLSVYHDWVAESGNHFEQVEVVCLKRGRANLPENVRVHSLGKPYSAKATKGAGTRLRYVFRFLSLVWQLRHDYDAVFVHMNQEYILIAGWLWKLFKKPIYLWRNHYAGSLLTDVAAALCTRVFCTSKHSYTAKYAKTKMMPVGVDTTRFFPDERIARKSRSVLFLSRISASKRPEILIDALAQLAQEGIEFSADFYGSPLPKDAAYYEGLKGKVRTLGLSGYVSFYPGIPNDQTPDLYRAHDIFVNTSPSGMLDKTLFEAAASGCLVLAASGDFADMVGEEVTFSDAHELGVRLAEHLGAPPVARDTMKKKLSVLVSRNALTALMTTLSQDINPSSPV